MFGVLMVRRTNKGGVIISWPTSSEVWFTTRSMLKPRDAVSRVRAQRPGGAVDSHELHSPVVDAFNEAVPIT